MEVANKHIAAPWLKDVHCTEIPLAYPVRTYAARQHRSWQVETSRLISSTPTSSSIPAGSLITSPSERFSPSGRYGDCMVLLRSLLEDTDLMTYFACYPEDATEWKERLSRAPVWSDEVYRRGTQKFRMRQIWKKLKEKGIEPIGERDYPILSATVHASPWGISILRTNPVRGPGPSSSQPGTVLRPSCRLLSCTRPPRDLPEAHPSVPRQLRRCQSAKVPVALDQDALRCPDRKLADPKWTSTLGSEMKRPTRKSASHAARTQKPSLRTYNNASTRGTGRNADATPQDTPSGT